MTLPETTPGNVFETAARFKRDLLRRERQAAGELVRAYGQAWLRIQARLNELENEYQALLKLGEKPGAAWIYEHNRLQVLRRQIERELEQFGRYAEETVRQEQRQAIAAAERQAETLARKALGLAPEGVRVEWQRIDTAAVAQMLGFTQADSPLHGLLSEIAGEGAKAAETALVQGMLLGKSPRETARRVRQALGTTLGRALRIARTETMRAQNESTLASYQANRDIVKGWVWHSAADGRTCASCLAMHGTVHRLDERLDDHPNGRCAMVPLTKSWAEIGKQLGIDLSDVPETRPEIKSGAELFERLTAEQQRQILGPAKWAAWKDGKLTLGDLVAQHTLRVGRKRSREWGTMRYERSLADVLGAEQAKRYTRLALLGLAKERLNADELIQVAGLGVRELTPAELKRVVEQAARAGFDPKATSIVRSSDMMGILWKGKPIQSGDDLPAGEWHFVKHVLARQEWPDGTEIDEYLESLKGIVRDPKSGIMISKYQDKYWQMTFIGKSSIYRGPGGNDFILVEYRVDYGHWVTGFQPASLEEQLTRYRENIQWLRQLKH